jgi:asparagine synthase (glutamine-hydrolysing)
MRIIISLKYNKGFRWTDNGSVFFKGFMVYNGKYLKEEQVVNLFNNCTGFHDIKDIIKSADGLFSLIIKKGNSVLLAVDRVRTFPLFYTTDEDITITDDPYSLQGMTDEISAREFLLTGLTTGSSTLIKNVSQTVASEILVLNDDGIKSELYYTHKTSAVFSETLDALIRQFKDILNSSFKDFIRTLDNRPVAVSLSGGYDSRLIALMLKHFEYKHVVCFTYGRKESNEIENSRKTAGILNYPWFFIEYNTEMARDYLNTEIFREYVRFAGKLSSMPFLQDYFAIKYIKENRLVDHETIFITGHSGDFIAGSHLMGKFRKSDKPLKVIREIFNSYYNISSLPGKSEFFKIIKNQITTDDFFAYSVFENWILQERQAKFIINSACVYDFFGYQYRMPLFDARILSFFKNVPHEYKNFKLLYDTALKELFSQRGLNFENELQASKKEILIQNIKNRVKKYVPATIIKKYAGNQPWNAYDILTAPMADDLKGTRFENQVSGNYNSVICNWYIKNLLS